MLFTSTGMLHPVVGNLVVTAEEPATAGKEVDGVNGVLALEDEEAPLL